VISSVLRPKLKRVSVMSRVKCLAYLVLVEHGADLKADSSFAAQRLALAGDGGGDAGKVALGGSEQILALAGALVGLQPTGGPGWSQPSPASSPGSMQRASRADSGDGGAGGTAIRISWSQG